MMAAAATGKMTPEEAVAWADKQIHGMAIYQMVDT